MSSDSLSENVLGGFDVDEEGAGIAEVVIKGEALTLGVDDETVACSTVGVSTTGDAATLEVVARAVVSTTEVATQEDVATVEIAMVVVAASADDVIVPAIVGVVCVLVPLMRTMLVLSSSFVLAFVRWHCIGL